MTALERIYKKWFEILGLAKVEDDSLTITNVGLDLLTADRFDEVISNQIIKFQYPDAIQATQSQWKRITPFPFILELLRRHDYISREEWVLFVNTAQSNEDMNYISDMIIEWRDLSENQHETISKLCKQIPINRSNDFLKFKKHSIKPEDIQ